MTCQTPRGSGAVPVWRRVRVRLDKGMSKSASSFLGVFTRVETGHMVMSSGGKGWSMSRGSASGPSHRS
jgi:hypothetical protein